MGLDNQEPMESDMVDDAPEPDIDEGVGETGDGAETGQKITTKFLTKYERGTYSAFASHISSNTVPVTDVSCLPSMFTHF